MNLKQTLITEAVKRFDSGSEVLKNNLELKFAICRILCGGTNVCEEHAMQAEEIAQAILVHLPSNFDQFISDMIAHTVDKTVEEIKSGIQSCSTGCSCGLEGYRVLPDCDKEKHDNRCVDCYLDSLTNKKGEE